MHKSHFFHFWILFVFAIISVFYFIQILVFHPKVRIIFLNVGQGDAILIQTSHGRNILIDSGKYDDISQKVDVYTNTFYRNIDMAIATHSDIDHIGGFYSLFDKYNVDIFLHSHIDVGSSLYRSIAKKVKQQNILHSKVGAGDIVFLDKDMFLEFIAPFSGMDVDDMNDYSLVTILHYHGSKVLLTGDASVLIEQKLVSLYGDSLQSQILKLGHHGSKTSSGDLFLEKVSPEYGIISAACNNSFGHPHVRVLQSLDTFGIKDIQTCEYGDIVFDFKNRSWVLQNKKEN